jgi:hypothetical protein
MDQACGFELVQGKELFSDCLALLVHGLRRKPPLRSRRRVLSLAFWDGTSFNVCNVCFRRIFDD